MLAEDLSWVLGVGAGGGGGWGGGGNNLSRTYIMNLDHLVNSKSTTGASLR